MPSPYYHLLYIALFLIIQSRLEGYLFIFQTIKKLFYDFIQQINFCNKMITQTYIFMEWSKEDWFRKKFPKIIFSIIETKFWVYLFLKSCNFLIYGSVVTTPKILTIISSHLGLRARVITILTKKLVLSNIISLFQLLI